MRAHTPGPWLIEQNNGYGNVICKDGRSMVAVWPTALDGTEFPAEANARLIAAAPELLEELQRARRVLVAEGYIPAATMDAAIAKATGANP